MRSCSVFLRESGTGLKRFQGRPFRRRLVSAVPPDTLSCTGIPASFLCPYRMAACLRDGESPHACESLWSLSFFPASAVRPFSVRRTGNGADSVPLWAESAEAGPPVLIEVFPPPCSERNGYACWICRNGEEPDAIPG